MKSKDIEHCIVKAFKNLNSNILLKLDSGYTYSGLDKEQLIEEVEKELKIIRARGITNLEVRPSKCKFCYPTGAVFSFHHTNTGELVIRYVIHQESIDKFIVEECRNKKLPDGENGLPF